MDHDNPGFMAPFWFTATAASGIVFLWLLGPDAWLLGASLGFAVSQTIGLWHLMAEARESET